jgi:peptidoglycan pentaglycine glycine transferase (the first glycine)
VRVRSSEVVPGSADGGESLELNVAESTWDAFVSRSTPGSYLQTSAWARVKATNGWSALRLMRSTEDGSHGVQILLRKPRVFPWAFAYAPRGPVSAGWNESAMVAFTADVRRALPTLPVRVSHVRIEPEIELNGPFDVDGELRHALRTAGWRPGTPIQPPRTRQVDLRADEAALWGNLRKKWRQYVNKARRDGITVVEAGPERLPEFYAIYRETAARAGFVIRTYESYVGVWKAFAASGMARLLLAEAADGTPVATLFLLQVGDRVVEPYGGMTGAGAESRANYLLKWEAIRSSRERGAVSYDMWGISHEGIEHFKAGFGGREIKYVGAWDLVVDPAGRLLFDSAQVVQDRIGAWRHGILKVRGRPHGPGEDQAG